MGLLTFLKNFLFPEKSRKNTTKASKPRTRKPSKKTKRPRVKKPSVIIEEEYDTIEFDVNDQVTIEHDIDKILDFLNGFPEELKNKVLTSLNKSEESFDKALFFVSSSLDTPPETYYMILCKVVTLDEKGLMLMYSKNIDLLSLYMSTITTLPYDKVKESFKEKPKNNK